MTFPLVFALLAPAADPAAKPNRLAAESSAYLRQHATNPVDWHPWGPEAFALAKKQGKLVFLSVGYSSCHWCHVMERESFANPAIAAVLNEHFVCIKVDREERPDVDEVYMTALQTLGLSGGWPLSAFLTADAKPIFGGTYWPPDDKKVEDGTITGFKTVLGRVIALQKEKPDELAAQAEKVAEMTAAAMARHTRALAIGALDAETVADAAAAFDIDPVHGGIGSKARDFAGTKFPRPAALGFLMRQGRRPGNEAVAKGVALTLEKMAAGGLYDHLGGGFHRYSTERTWTVPHFEKMLYDQAQLVELYAEAYRLDPKPEYKRVVDETLAFVAREMTSPDGAFYSALDADTHHEEGRFYVWTDGELTAALGTGPDAKRFREVYGLTAPNFEGKYHILRLAKTADATPDLAPLKAKLFAEREKRDRPFRDTKVLTGWNGQMITGYAAAGRALNNREYIKTAERAAEFVLANLRGPDGRLRRVWSAAPGGKPEARLTASLEDTAFLAHGLFALHRATGDDRWLTEAKAVADQMAKWYEDAARGGFYTTAHDAEKLFARGMDSFDGAQPSGNGTAARVFAGLWLATKDEKYWAAAERTVRHFTGVLKANPNSVPQLVDALDTLLANGGLGGAIAKPEPPAVPKASADVVAAALTAGPSKDGARPFTLTLTVAKPWHVYANPVGGKDLAESETRVEVLAGGEPVPAKLTFPAGTPKADPLGGEYRIYEGTVTITGTAAASTADEPLAVRVRVVACKDGTCLLPSVLKVVAK